MSDSGSEPRSLRSHAWFGPDDVGGLMHRAFMRSQGFSSEALRRGPVVGICNSASDLNNCNVHLRSLAAAVKRGVAEAGGVPLEFPTISLGEQFMKPTAMLFRNLMAMDVEETIRANPLDAVVLLGGCDKTTPAQIMGALSADVPALVLTGGPRLSATFRGEPLASGSDLWRYTADLRAGRMSEAEYASLEGRIAPSPGHCMEMGTASTMAAIAEALGLAMPGSSTVPAPYGERLVLAESAGRLAVEIALEDRRPSAIVTGPALENAARVLGAIGGSTNAVIHLLAIAGRAGVEIDLARICELAGATPLLANVKPLGEYMFEDLGEAGGIPALMGELGADLDREARSVCGGTIGEAIGEARSRDQRVIRVRGEAPAGGDALAMVRGSLAPAGAVLKPLGFPPHLRRHRGPALVFEGVDDLLARIDDPGLEATPDSVLVLRGIGPVGAPGMPEWGKVPVPQPLLREGVDDMLCLSDGRVSGTVSGSVIAHVAPEAAVGGPLAAVETGDIVSFDLAERRLDLELAPAEIERRLAARRAHAREPRGYARLYAEHVLQADQGCDFDFLRATPQKQAREPKGLFEGWLDGW